MFYESGGDKAVNRCFFLCDCNLDWYKTPEMCDKVVSKDLSWTVYCPDKYMLKECVLKLLMIL